MCLWCSIMKRNEIVSESMFIPIEKRTTILKIVEVEVFLLKPKHQIIYPNKENAVMVPNHEKKGDYYLIQVYPN